MLDPTGNCSLNTLRFRVPRAALLFSELHAPTCDFRELAELVRGLDYPMSCLQSSCAEAQDAIRLFLRENFDDEISRLHHFRSSPGRAFHELSPAWLEPTLEFRSSLSQSVSDICQLTGSSKVDAVQPLQLMSKRLQYSLKKSTELIFSCFGESAPDPGEVTGREVPVALEVLKLCMRSNKQLKVVCEMVRSEAGHKNNREWHSFDRVLRLQECPPRSLDEVVIDASVLPRIYKSIQIANVAAQHLFRTLIELADPTWRNLVLCSNSPTEWQAQKIEGLVVPPRLNLFQSAIFSGPTTGAFFDSLNRVIDKARTGLPSAETDLAIPMGHKITTLGPVANVGDINDGTFAHSLGPLGKILKTPASLDGRLLVFRAGVPFSGTSTEARLSVVVAVTEYVEEWGGRVWIDTPHKSDRATLAPYFVELFSDSEGLKEKRAGFDTISEETAGSHIRGVNQKLAERVCSIVADGPTNDLVSYDDVLANPLRENEANWKELFLFGTSDMFPLMQRLPGWTREKDNEFVASFERSMRMCLGKDGDTRHHVVSVQGSQVPTRSAGGRLRLDIIPSLAGTPGSQIQVDCGDGTNPVLFLGSNSSGKTELLRQFALAHFCSRIRIGIFGDAEVPDTPVVCVLGGNLELQLRKIMAAFSAWQDGVPGTLYVDEFMAHPEEVGLLQRWLIRETQARGIKVVFTSNQPWSILPLIQELNGVAIEVNRTGDHRTYTKVSDGVVSFTPRTAAQGAIDALSGVLPDSILVRARELITEFVKN